MGIINELLEKQAGFITSPEELQQVIEESRLRPVLVRCGCGRFTAPAQDVQHFVDIITKEKTDYVRDISVMRS